VLCIICLRSFLSGVCRGNPGHWIPVPKTSFVSTFFCGINAVCKDGDSSMVATWRTFVLSSPAFSYTWDIHGSNFIKCPWGILIISGAH